MLISKHINFGCAAPKWLFSLYVNKSAVSHDQCDTKWSWWIKQEAYYVGQLVNLNWSVCFCLLFAICDAVLIKQAMVWFLKPFKRYFKKYVNSKSPLFDQPCPLYAWTRFWSYPPILSLYGRTKLFCSFLQKLNELSTSPARKYLYSSP